MRYASRDPGRLLLAAWCMPLALSVVFAGFYDTDAVNRIELAFAESNWDAILDSLYARGLEERLVGCAVINGVRFESVGVRYKGHSSYNPTRAKNPLNIKLDEVIPEQLLEGHGTLRLANIYKDPSCVREVLSCEIVRKYTPASRANFANVYVNDTLTGLYTNVEDVDRLFVREKFYRDENARFKGQMTDSAPMAGWKYYGTDSVPYREYFQLESDSSGRDWRELIQFLDTLNNHTERVEEVLNVDRHLWMLAFDILMVNLDAPVNMPQNHYLLQDVSGRFNPVIWDLNENFGAFRDLQGTGQLSLAQMQRLDPFLRSADAEYPICSRILAQPAWRRDMVAHMRTMIAENFANDWYEDRAFAIQDIVAPYVQADPNKFYSYNDFLNNVNRTAGSGPLAIVGLTELMNTRISWLQGRAEFQATPPAISEIAHAPETAVPNSNVLFSARVEGADSVLLGYRQTAATRFRRTAMFDDGLHGDGSAGDGVYAVSLPVGSGDVEYYVRAENAETAAFAPERAEFEFLTLPVAGDVVINEFLAINGCTVPDPNGEYDDWIELRNNSDRTVLLDAYLLSNDTLELTRWSFPDITIPAGGYQIVWADDDLNQPGLHANFELGGSGGLLVLSDPDGVPLDRVLFGQQRTDTSFGRYPNGLGANGFMPPTFAACNQSAGVAERPEIAATRPFLSAFPNPFPGATSVRFDLASPGRISLRVYDATGRLVQTLAEGRRTSGRHQVEFRAPPGVTAEGVYFVRLESGANGGATGTASAKLVLMK